MDVHRSPTVASYSPKTPLIGNTLSTQNSSEAGGAIRRNLFSAVGHSERSGCCDVLGNGVHRVRGYGIDDGSNITNDGGSTPRNRPWQPLPNAPYYGRYPYAG